MKKFIKFAIGFIVFCYAIDAIATPEWENPYVKDMYDPIIGLPQIIKSKQAHCLAMNIYHESRSDNLAGQFAVADVVMNRVESDRYPDTICGVVYQARMKPSWKDPEVMVPVRNKCQFSWYCDGKDDTPHEQESWAKAQYVAWSMLENNDFRGITEGATHYHTTYVTPYWGKHFHAIGRIGSHVFYKS